MTVKTHTRVFTVDNEEKKTFELRLSSMGHRKLFRFDQRYGFSFFFKHNNRGFAKLQFMCDHFQYVLSNEMME